MRLPGHFRSQGRGRRFEQPFPHDCTGRPTAQHRIAHGRIFGRVGFFLRAVSSFLCIPSRALRGGDVLHRIGRMVGECLPGIGIGHANEYIFAVGVVTICIREHCLSVCGRRVRKSRRIVGEFYLARLVAVQEIRHVVFLAGGVVPDGRRQPGRGEVEQTSDGVDCQGAYFYEIARLSAHFDNHVISRLADYFGYRGIAGIGRETSEGTRGDGTAGTVFKPDTLPLTSRFAVIPLKTIVDGNRRSSLRYLETLKITGKSVGGGYIVRADGISCISCPCLRFRFIGCSRPAELADPPPLIRYTPQLRMPVVPRGGDIGIGERKIEYTGGNYATEKGHILTVSDLDKPRLRRIVGEGLVLDDIVNDCFAAVRRFHQYDLVEGVGLCGGLIRSTADPTGYPIIRNADRIMLIIVSVAKNCLPRSHVVAGNEYDTYCTVPGKQQRFIGIFEIALVELRAGQTRAQYSVVHGSFLGFSSHVFGVIFSIALRRVPLRALGIGYETVSGILHSIYESEAAGCGYFEISRTFSRFHGRRHGLVIVGNRLALPVAVDTGNRLPLGGKIEGHRNARRTGERHHHNAAHIRRILGGECDHAGGHVVTAGRI